MISWVEVYQCRHDAQCQELALVLLALGIDPWIDGDGAPYRILVALEDAPRARLELAEYEAESAAGPPPETGGPEPTIRPRAILGYWVVLLVVYHWEIHRSFALDWLEMGRLHGELVRQGQWWRPVTALTLHADASHLLNNLIFGSLFGLLLRPELGTGLMWFSILLAGAVGNGVNAYLHPPDHLAIGASTGVFGAIGLLVGLQWKRYSREKPRRLRRWAPPIVGGILLGYLGTGGERTDVLAHICGTASGGVLGLLINLFPRRLSPTGLPQVLLGGATLLILVLSWVAAFSNR